jgi:hypothetical protein
MCVPLVILIALIAHRSILTFRWTLKDCRVLKARLKFDNGGGGKPT